MIMTHAYKNNTPFQTVDIPAHVDSFMAWESFFPFNGHIIGDPHIMHVNTHATKFRSGLLIKASATELGLNETRFYSLGGCQAVRTSKAGFASNAELIAYLRGRCPQCFDTHQKLMCNATSAYGVSSDGVAWGYDPTMH